jgi:hypothetical protein
VLWCRPSNLPIWRVDVFLHSSREIVSRSSAHNGIPPLINNPPLKIPQKVGTIADQNLLE